MNKPLRSQENAAMSYETWFRHNIDKPIKSKATGYVTLMHHIEEILHEIGFIEDIETATTVLEVTKKCPKPCSTISRTCKIDLIRLTSYHRQPCVSKFCDIRKNDVAKFHME